VKWPRCMAILNVEHRPLTDACPVHVDVEHLCRCGQTVVTCCCRRRWHLGKCEAKQTPSSVRGGECPGPDASWSGVDDAPFDNAAKVWRCDVCGAEGVAVYLSQQRNHVPPHTARGGESDG
jgi:hypothetical protein